MTIRGKGFYIWKIARCENGDPQAITTLAKQANMSHVLLKVADGNHTYNYDWNRKKDLVAPVVKALHQAGIQAWGWHYIYGDDPAGEAKISIQRIRELGLDGFVINAEIQYETRSKAPAAKKYMNKLRAALPNTPLALSSFRYPSYHAQLPWKEFLSRCDYSMPQVYWMQAHNAGAQLERTLREYRNIMPNQPIIPTGAAFTEYGWTPTASEVLEFLQTAKRLKLEVVNFWEWYDARYLIPKNIWNTIRDFSWPFTPPTPPPPPTPPQDITEQYIAALNTQNPDQMINLYIPNAVHITSARTAYGTDKIRAWYQLLFTQILPHATFKLTGYSGSGNSRHFTWSATSQTGNVLNGNDTFGLSNEKIGYHYTFFTIGQPH